MAGNETIKINLWSTLLFSGMLGIWPEFVVACGIPNHMLSSATLGIWIRTLFSLFCVFSESYAIFCYSGYMDTDSFHFCFFFCRSQ